VRRVDESLCSHLVEAEAETYPLTEVRSEWRMRMRLKLKILLFIIMGILFSNSTLLASVSGVGGGEFLEKGVGARALGMGMAYVAVCDDANALYWNPAGLGLLEGRQITSMTTKQFEVDYTNIVYAQPFMGGGIGISFLRADVGGMEVYGDDPTQPSSGTFKYTADAFTISCGREIREKVMVGVSLKYIHQKLYDTSGKGWGMDLGILCNLNDNLSLGLNLQDITGTKIKWDTSSKVSGSEGAEDKIPLNMKVGVAYKIEVGGQKKDVRGKNLTLAVDMDKQKDRDVIYHLGMEYLVNENIALRVGVDEDKLAAGVGVSLNNWQIDYSYNEHKLGDTSRVSLGYRF